MAAKGGKRTIKPKAGSGQKPITFKSGGLHASTKTPAGQPIPAAKMQAALDGKLGPKAQKQANFAKNVLGVKPGAASTAKAGAKGAAKGATRGR
jgi:hypothetical protein